MRDLWRNGNTQRKTRSPGRLHQQSSWQPQAIEPAALADVSDQRSSDVKSAEGQQPASDHRVMSLILGAVLVPLLVRSRTTSPLRDARVTETRRCIGAIKNANQAAARGHRTTEIGDDRGEPDFEFDEKFTDESCACWFMYGRSFRDLDVHPWEAMWVSPKAVQQHPAEMAQST